MTRITWDVTGERTYETGVDRGVLFVTDRDGDYGNAVAWNGLVSVTESPEGAEPNPQYADNIKYLNLISAEELKGTIEAFTYPEEFEECDGTREVETGVVIGQQPRRTFALCYRTILGNDTQSNDYGYKLHFVYGAVAQPSEKAYETVNDSPEAITFSWEFETTPVDVEGFRPTAIAVVDSTKISEDALAAIEDYVYGDSEGSGELPFPDEIVDIIESADA